MALPSQIERSAEMSRPVMTRGTKRASVNATWYWVGAVALVVAAGAIYGIYRWMPGSQGGPAAASAAMPKPDEKVAATPKELAKEVKNNSKTDAKIEPKPAPLVTIEQGGNKTPVTNLPNTLGQALTPETPGGATNKAADPGVKPAPVDVNTPDLKPRPADQPAAATPGGTTPPTLTATGSTQNVRSQMEAGDRAMAANKLVEARLAYSRAMANSECSKSDQEVLRSKLTAINEDLVFSSKVTPGDPLTEQYTVAAGDALEKIRKKRDLTTEWMLIQRVNKMPNAHSLKVGQKLKLVRGPFHAVVHKADFRLDLFAGSPDDTENWIYIRSFKVGLGEGNGTPLGTYSIKSKQQNPPWTNPRTGEKFGADDPKNPIGEFWLGWQGLGDAAVHTGFGLHGTVDPASIGQQKSMGCVRMLPDDIALVYEMMGNKVSLVKVVP
ncbi:MAG: L,D-transpeptidase family protein [Planctomycetes bacterium]|nr:L,D-transpeptidase family protein [Planctomycetota bacterium]